MCAGEDLGKGIERACTDIAEDNADRPNSEQAEPAARPPVALTADFSHVGSLVMDPRVFVVDLHQVIGPVASRARPSLRTPLVTMSSAISLHKRRSR